MTGIDLASKRGPSSAWKCVDCQGMWLDQRACETLVNEELSNAERDFIRIDARRAVAAPVQGGYRDAARQPGDSGMACPVCREAVVTYVTSEARHGVRVKLDVCAGHGTWFDRGECRSLLMAVELKRLNLQFERDHGDLRGVEAESQWPHTGPDPVAPLPAAPARSIPIPREPGAWGPATEIPRARRRPPPPPRPLSNDPDANWSALVSDLSDLVKKQSAP